MAYDNDCMVWPVPILIRPFSNIVLGDPYPGLPAFEM